MRAESGAMGMERVNRIWRHRTYQECLEKIRAHEETRESCRKKKFRGKKSRQKLLQSGRTGFPNLRN